MKKTLFILILINIFNYLDATEIVVKSIIPKTGNKFIVITTYNDLEKTYSCDSDNNPKLDLRISDISATFDEENKPIEIHISKNNSKAVSKISLKNCSLVPDLLVPDLPETYNWVKKEKNNTNSKLIIP
jgi:hypothetical protein